MKRSILALIVGFAAWVLVASLLDRGLRMGFAGYATAEPMMKFTLAMKVARLILGALASLAAGQHFVWSSRRERSCRGCSALFSWSCSSRYTFRSGISFQSGIT